MDNIHTVLVSSKYIIVHAFDVVGTKRVCLTANIVGADCIAIFCLIDAIASPIKAVVELCLYGVIIGRVVVRVARINGEVIIGLVLDQWIVPVS